MDDERIGTTNPVSTRRVLSRRHFLAGVTATAGAAILAACGGSSATNTPKAAGATSAPAAAPTTAAGAATTAPATSGSAAAPTTAAAAAPAGGTSKGKALKMSRNGEPQSPLIPWQIDDNTALFISVNMYDTLLRTTKDGLGIEPGLATKWEPSADSLTWTFTLRDNLKFSDGTPVKGVDVKTSLDTVSKGAKSVWKDSYKAIKDVQTPDDKTVKITLNQPHAPILSELAMFCAAVLPAQLAMDSDKDGFDAATATKSKGTGAYSLNGWNKGEPLVLTRNPNYWKSTTGIDTVTIEYVADDNARILKLQGGETDIIDFVPLSQLASLGQQPNITTQAFVIQQSSFFILNNTIKPLDDMNIRQALNYALDKDAILKAVYFGQAKFMNSPIPPGTYYDKTLPGYPFNLDKAKQLMAASSMPNGFSIDFTIASGSNSAQQLATIAKDQWSKIGVTVNIQSQEASVLRTAYRDGTGKLAIISSSWTNDMNDPTEIVNYEMRGGASPFAYWTRYNNPALNDKITAADLEQDATKRAADYADIQKTYLDAAPLVFVSYPPATAGWQKYVEGFFIDGLSYYRFEDVKVNK